MGDSPSRPLIGLTTHRQAITWGSWDREAAFVPGTYLDVVVRAGGVPVLVPPRGAAMATGCHERPDGKSASDLAGDLDAVCDALDGLILTGGGDVGPDHYGQRQGPCTTGTNADRDQLEFELVTRAVDRDLPVLAVCRGLQVLNVGLGGDLVQHLPDRTGSTAHQPRPAVFGPVLVTTEPGSHVRDVFGDQIEVSCCHHQAVDRLGHGLRVTARSEDGVVEAAEFDSLRFMVGVQWHPEEPGDIRLFEHLVAASCQRRMQRDALDPVAR